SEPVTVRDSSDQHLVWCRLHFGLVTLVASDHRWVQLRPVAGLFFQHRLILINDIWLGLAILGFASSAASPSSTAQWPENVESDGAVGTWSLSLAHSCRGVRRRRFLWPRH